MNKKILVVAMLGLVVLAVSSSGCTWPTITPPDLRMPSSLVVKWLGGDSTSGAGLKVSGQLLDPNTNLGIADKSIFFYGSNDAKFNQPNPEVGDTQQVTLQAQTTDPQGRFAFTLQSKDDKYLIYSVQFTGDSLNNAGNYKGSASTVGGYLALNVIANQLRLDLLKLPENVFVQAATKSQLLSTLSFFKLMVGSGRYSAAATTFNNGFAKRMDGYATSGAPDANDVLRTQAAQDQLYPRASIAVEDCQWLSGGPGYTTSL